MSFPMEASQNSSIDCSSVKDAKGSTYRLGPGKSEGVAAWRLEPFNDLRLCVPAAVEVQPPPAVSVTEVSERTDNRNPIFKSVKDAVKKLISRGGGTFLYRVPIATVRLREEAAAVVTSAPGERDWPECVSGAVVGVTLRVAIMLTPSASTALPSIVADPDESRAVSIECETCRICIVQKGGPPLDPAKLYGRHEEGIAQELEIWAKRAKNKPTTWRLLNIEAQAANVDAPSRLAVHSAPQILQSLGRQLGDLVLAAVADIEFCIEPFEISYGESHLESVRCMVAEEIANLLGISSDQVMCGSFKLKSVIPKRRHVRRNSMMLQIALLHQGLIEVVRGPQMPTRKAADPLPELVSKKLPSRFTKSTTKMWTVDPLTETAEPTSPTGTKKSIALTRALTTLKDTQEAFSQTMRDSGLNKSSSEPSLTKSKDLFDSFYAKSGSFPSKDMPPDQLLKTLMHILGDTTHPIRKHPQIFPMFARISKQAVVVRAPLVASQDIIDPEQMAESIRELMKPRRVRAS